MPSKPCVSTIMRTFPVTLVIMVSIILIASNGVSIPTSSASDEDDKLPEFDKLWNYQHPDKTEAKFRELLPIAEKAGDISYHIQLLTQIARTQGLQQKFDEAHQTLDEAEKMVNDQYPLGKIRYLLERGRVFNSAKSPDKAKPLFIQAWEFGVKHKQDYYAVDAAHMMGIIETPIEALRWNEKALKYAEDPQHKKAKLWLGSLYNNIGWTYFDQKKYDQALELFQKDVKWYQEMKKPYQTRVARWSVAKTLRHQGKTQAALNMQQEILKEIEESKADADGYVFEELGECLYALDKKEAAQNYFAKAYKLLSKDQWLVRDEPERLERLKKLGKVETAEPVQK
ncbi:tetratricopeptide repeat protein [candidate division CSSED10-310 bacterium]|uniref:Tetratricopeptide repeat protein n=1 Tax=candidate division CSSED10-310 bacterium TaxID=2855610 RepID=A0ABV6YUD6_UNCC1